MPSRKDYERETTIFNKVVNTKYMDMATVAMIVGGFALSHEADNPRFDKERYFAAAFAKPKEES
jgi:hypothetical protein